MGFRQMLSLSLAFAIAGPCLAPGVAVAGQAPSEAVAKVAAGGRRQARFFRRKRRLRGLSARAAVSPPPPAPPPPIAPPLDTDTEIAKRHFEFGLKNYAAGDYAGALVEFKTARQVKPHPAFDYNIGKCEDRMEHIPEAIEAYQRYLAAMPDAPDAPELTRRVAMLDFRRSRASEIARVPEPAQVQPRARAAETRPTEIRPASDATENPSVTASPARDRGGFARDNAVPIGVGAFATATLVTGIALLGSAVPDYNHLHDSCIGHCSDEQVTPVANRAQAGEALIAIGAAAAATDGVLWYLAWRKHKRQGTTWVVAPTVFGATCAGTF